MDTARVNDTVQTVTIPDWHPAWNPNGTGNRSHWAVLGKRKKADEMMTWASAKQAGWQPVNGKAKLTIFFVYPRRYRIDADNLYSRCKGMIDAIVRGGWIKDDSTEWLDLTVTSAVEPGVRAIRLQLEAA